VAIENSYVNGPGINQEAAGVSCSRRQWGPALSLSPALGHPDDRSQLVSQPELDNTALQLRGSIHRPRQTDEAS